MISDIFESQIIALAAILFISSWAYRQGRASRNREIKYLHTDLKYFQQLSRELLKNSKEDLS